MLTTKFENERTFEKLVTQGHEDEFHREYETAYSIALGKLAAHYPNVVAGEPRFSKLGEFQDICPFNNSIVVGSFQKGTRQDVIDAVQASDDAQVLWEKVDVEHRCAVFRSAADELSRRKYEFSAGLTLENGKKRFGAIAGGDEATDYVRCYPHT